MITTTSHSSLWKKAPGICLFITEGFVLDDPGRIVRRKGKWGGSKGDLSSGFIVLSRVAVKPRPSQSRPHKAYELMIPLESIGRIVTLKKPRGKNTKVFSSTAELRRRLDAFERACDLRFEVLLQAINQLTRPKVPEHRSTRRVLPAKAQRRQRRKEHPLKTR